MDQGHLTSLTPLTTDGWGLFALLEVFKNGDRRQRGGDAGYDYVFYHSQLWSFVAHTEHG